MSDIWCAPDHLSCRCCAAGNSQGNRPCRYCHCKLISRTVSERSRPCPFAPATRGDSEYPLACRFVRATSNNTHAVAASAGGTCQARLWVLPVAIGRNAVLWKHFPDAAKGYCSRDLSAAVRRGASAYRRSMKRPLRGAAPYRSALSLRHPCQQARQQNHHH